MTFQNFLLASKVNGKLYFGEYTFFHGGGFTVFDDYYEKKLGDLIDVD